MSDRSLRLLAALLLALLLAPSARAADAFGDVIISTLAGPQGANLHGYSEYRFQVENKGDRAHKVRITLPGTDGAAGRGMLASVSREIEVGGGSFALLSIAYPAHPAAFGRGAAVSIDGVRQLREIGVDLVSSRWSGGGFGGPHHHGRGRSMPAIARIGIGGGGLADTLVLHSTSLDETFFLVPAGRGIKAEPGGRPFPGPQKGGVPGAPPPAPGAPGDVAPEPGPPGVPGEMLRREGDPYLGGQIVRANAPAPSWSDNWLAYTRYDGVVLRQRDVAELDATSPRTKAVLAALWRYAEAGGVVVVVGQGDIHLPKSWQASERRGVFNVHAVGFGQCLHAAEADPSRWADGDWQTAGSAFSMTNSPWQSDRYLAALHDSFPVVDRLGVPTTGLFVLMMVFAAAIGPLNLYLLSRLNRRIWMLWTVPLVSFVTCVAVLVYMILGEGWGGHARLAGITLLDQAEKRATTLARTAYYSPLTPGGLTYPEDAEVLPSGGDHAAHAATCGLEWGGGQHLTRGWVTARVPAHFTVRRSEGRTERRLDLYKNDDGIVSVRNGLGAAIAELSVAGDDGQIYVSAGPIAAGDPATLNPTREKAKGDRRGWRPLYTTADWGLKDRLALGKTTELLAPRTYLAVVEQSPFLEPGLRGATLRPSPSVVLGVFSGLGAK